MTPDYIIVNKIGQYLVHYVRNSREFHVAFGERRQRALKVSYEEAQDMIKHIQNNEYWDESLEMEIV
jgi:oligoribonuclease NrnB/cAMP/cGMP phosphodiesterase (DHH superfamily)